MHPVRRRKKRPNYGVRTVEVSRGDNGFGFTISGQQPCILSCIVAGSPAERAGLRPGDYLVAVNGQSVSKIPHDDVVRLIGSSFGILKLQIAENYYSDSSDEDIVSPARPKPKHPHKPRNNNVQQRAETSNPQQMRAAKVVRDLRTGAMFVEQQLEVVSVPEASMVRGTCKSNGVLQHWDPPVPLGVPQPPPRLYLSPQPDKAVSLTVDHVEYRALVGYLGTIEMPRELLPGSRLQVVRGCIKRLRAEKRAHTLVLMSIRTYSLVLTNCHESTLAEYPAERVKFCGVGSDDQHRFFGLVTSATRDADEDDNGEVTSSSSCHVFAVEVRLHGRHVDHAAKAEAFKLCCHEDESSGTCPEFPASSDPVVAAVKVLYSRQRDESGNAIEEPLVANSPQPSNASSTVTTTSSNSDSGIGFRDECGGNHSDRILMVDIQNQRLHIQQMVSNNDSQSLYQRAMNPPKSCKYDFPIPMNASRSKRCIDDGCSSRLTVRAMPDPISNLSGASIAVSSRSRSPLNSTSSEGESLNIKTHSKVYSEKIVSRSNCVSNENYHTGNVLCNLSARSNDDMSVSSETNKSEDPAILSCQAKSYPDFSSKALPSLHFSSRFYERSDNSNFNCSVFSGLRSDNARSTEAMSVDSSQSQDLLMSYKLSPKVFGLSRPVTTHSLEDLKPNGVLMDGEEEETPMNLSSNRVQQWGSLQELRSFVANCFQASPAAEHLNQPQLKKWSNSSVMCKTYVRSQNPQRPRSLTYRTASDDEMLKKHTEQQVSIEPQESQKGVGSWSASFEKLLEDPIGLHTFAEFLKKEFSHENIYFWVACEKYRKLTNIEDRKAEAKAIFDSHLCLGALEPVNVDSHARQTTQDGLEEASETLFLQAQKQILNLMKFDSYPRFIKSDLYKECLLRHISGQQLPFPGDTQLDTGLQLNVNAGTPKDHSKLKKSRSDAEDHRRKSLLPWHRKNRSKSKDRGESEYQKMHTKCNAEDTVSVRSDVTSSRSSLASWDLALRGSFSRRSLVPGEVENTLCRVILPDAATTVVQTRPHESVRDLVLRLLDKRGLNYSGFQVFTQDSNKAVSLDAESSVLSGQEVRVERRVVFRLDLPNRKTVGVKSKPTKTLAEVLRPILHKYGYKLDLITLCLMSENEVLELNLPVVAVDNQRLQVLTRSGEGWKSEPSHSSVVHAKLKAGPTLDEITNRVFEELLQCKADDARTASDQNSVRSEDWGSEHSSGIFGRFLRRDSAILEKARESRIKNKKAGAASKILLDETDTRSIASSSRPKQLFVPKWKAGGVKMQGRLESDLSPDLYEGLKRAQRSRLEDQRGTEINFELPDFLKDKENAPQTGKKFRKLRKSDGESGLKMCDNSELQQTMSSSQESLSGTASNGGKRNLSTPFLDQTYGEGINTTIHKAEQYFLNDSNFTSTPTAKSNVLKSGITKSGNNASCTSMDDTVISSHQLDTTLTYESINAESGSTGQRPTSDPPPLPPKPKHLPIKAALWNNISSIPNQPPTFRMPVEITNSNSKFVRPDAKRDPKVCRSRRAVYLDQPSSSFV